MSDIKRVVADRRLVARDKRNGKLSMTSAVVRSHRMLVCLTTANHRGPADTWTAARDRTARQIGIDATYAARIWSRWQTMKDVSGEAFMRLKEAYDAECAKHEAVADYYHSLERAPDGRSPDKGSASAGLGMVAVPPSSARSARELHRG